MPKVGSSKKTTAKTGVKSVVTTETAKDPLSRCREDKTRDLRKAGWKGRVLLYVDCKTEADYFAWSRQNKLLPNLRTTDSWPKVIEG